MSKTTSYKILIKSGRAHYKLGTIIIKTFDGDIMYTPSQAGISESNSNIIFKVIDHVSWHRSGRVHIKTKNGGYKIFEEGLGVLNPIIGIEQTRQEIKDIGFQEILRDIVADISTLPKYTGEINELDVILNINGYAGAIQFIFSIVSGTHIVALFEGKETPIKTSENIEKLDNQKRCLGAESGNADKLLQYVLNKYLGGNLAEGGRRLFIAPNSKIQKIK